MVNTWKEHLSFDHRLSRVSQRSPSKPPCMICFKCTVKTLCSHARVVLTCAMWLSNYTYTEMIIYYSSVFCKQLIPCEDNVSTKLSYDKENVTLFFPPEENPLRNVLHLRSNINFRNFKMRKNCTYLSWRKRRMTCTIRGMQICMLCLIL